LIVSSWTTALPESVTVLERFGYRQRDIVFPGFGDDLNAEG